MRRLMVTLVSAAVLALVGVAPAPADASLVGDWPFDAGSGTSTADVSGNANNGTLNGGVQWVPGHTGDALGFDGSTGYVQVSDSASLEPAQVTVQAWVKLAGSPGDFKYIVAKGANGCDAASYGLYSGPTGGLMFYVATNDGLSFARSPDAGTGVWDGRWHLVTGTYDGSTVRLYVDGSQVGGRTGTPWTSPISYALPTTNDLFFGYYPGCSGLDFNGAIDEPKIWDRALSPQEVEAQYYPPNTQIASNFNATAIPAGDTIWFNSVLKVHGLPPGQTTTLRFASQQIRFANTTIELPDTVITFSPTATQATLSFSGSEWVETVPSSFGDNVFLSGAAYPVPAGGLAGAISPVSWQGALLSATPDVSVQWQWAAAVYTQFSSNLNAIGVKPLHSNNLDQYPNGDQAATPENYKPYVTAGAAGGGGSNWTGGYSATATATPYH
jgi:Concanavalin A-like lectin/glucanases superfamily